MKRKTEHTIFKNGNLFCSHCGGEQVLLLPIRIEMMTAMITAFNKIHKNCAPIWKEPEVKQEWSVAHKAAFWFRNGERGASSEAMWFCLMGRPGRKDHPYDPDDFSRCYKLLQAVPEWKSELHKLKTLSPVWDKLVDNWEILTRMFEENERTKWKNHKNVGMYDLMKTLVE